MTLNQWQLARMDAFNRAYAAALSNGQIYVSAENAALSAIAAFERHFPRPANEFPDHPRSGPGAWGHDS